MEIALTLHHSENILLPINYQYEVSSWIYKVLSRSDTRFATWLHSQGYTTQNSGRQFKLFTFSRLRSQPFKILPERNAICFQGNRTELNIRFLVDDALQHFVRGLFENQYFGLGAPGFQPIDFEVGTVEVLQAPSFESWMRFRARTPIVVSECEEGMRYAQFRSPNYTGYSHLLLNNLVHKLESATFLTGQNRILHDVQGCNLAFQCLSPPRQKKITIKSGRPGQSEIIGFEFDFEITAPAPLLRLGYYAGFGEDNAQGFGYVGVGG
jgi:CRISPR-associated endoribonuclease Cas6